MIPVNAYQGRNQLMRLMMGLWLAASLLFGTAARAEVPEVRFAQQFSMGYLQFNVMKHQDLLQKHAAALGIPEVKISYVTFNGPDMMNDALLSGAVDVASGGVPGLLTIWAKTRGTAQEVRGISAMSQQVVLLTSKDPNIRSIRDFKPGDRIAVPAVKVSAQAVMLQMAAAKEWGDAAFDKLDALTFSRSPPDATASLLSGGTGQWRALGAFGPLTRALAAPSSPASEKSIPRPRVIAGGSANSVASRPNRSPPPKRTNSAPCAPPPGLATALPVRI